MTIKIITTSFINSTTVFFWNWMTISVKWINCSTLYIVYRIVHRRGGGGSFRFNDSAIICYLDWTYDQIECHKLIISISLKIQWWSRITLKLPFRRDHYKGPSINYVSTLGGRGGLRKPDIFWHGGRGGCRVSDIRKKIIS